MSPRETLEPIGDEELFDLFAPHRPQADAFQAGIEERIARGRGREGAAEKPVESRLWRRVASFLPVDAAGAAGLGAGSGGKALSLALALPVLVLASVFGGFFAGARSLRRSAAGATPVQRFPSGRARRLRGSDRDLLVGQGMQVVIQFATLTAVTVAWLFGGSTAIDVLTAVLVLSMFGLVVTVRGLARVGSLERHDVAGIAVGLLLTVFLGCFLWFQNMRVADDVSTLGIGWAACAVLLGIPLCLLLAGRVRIAAVALALVAGAAWFMNTPGATRSSAGDLRAQLDRLDLDPQSLANWREAQALHGALVAVDAPLPDLSALRTAVARAAHDPADVHPTVWTAAYHMGLIDDAGWRALAPHEAHKLDQLETYGTFNRTAYYQYVFPMLIATREIDPDERADLARAVVDSWPEVGEHGALELALARLAELDALGHPDLAEGLRPRVHALLQAYWFSGEGGGRHAKVGGFTSDPEKFRTSFDDATLAGIELMGRFGVPQGIDLHLMHSYLRRACVGRPLLFEVRSDLRATERAALLRLRDQIGLPPRGALVTLLAERLTIATVLIVLLCALAVRLAPAVPDVSELERNGAQPRVRA